MYCSKIPDAGLNIIYCFYILDSESFQSRLMPRNPSSCFFPSIASGNEYVLIVVSKGVLTNQEIQDYLSFFWGGFARWCEIKVWVILWWWVKESHPISFCVLYFCSTYLRENLEDNRLQTAAVWYWSSQSSPTLQLCQILTFSALICSSVGICKPISSRSSGKNLQFLSERLKQWGTRP